MNLNQDSSVYRLFYHSYHCQVAYFNTINQEWAEEFGIRGNHIDNESNGRQPVDVLLSVDDMVEYFREGATIQLMNASDASKTYNTIIDHFKMWIDVGYRSHWCYNPPMEDFELLDSIAKDVYGMAMGEILTRTADMPGRISPIQFAIPLEIGVKARKVNTSPKVAYLSPLIEIRDLISGLKKNMR